MHLQPCVVERLHRRSVVMTTSFVGRVNHRRRCLRRRAEPPATPWQRARSTHARRAGVRVVVSLYSSASAGAASSTEAIAWSIGSLRCGRRRYRVQLLDHPSSSQEQVWSRRAARLGDWCNEVDCDNRIMNRALVVPPVAPYRHRSPSSELQQN